MWAASVVPHFSGREPGNLPSAMAPDLSTQGRPLEPPVRLWCETRALERGPGPLGTAVSRPPSVLIERGSVQGSTGLQRSCVIALPLFSHSFRPASNTTQKRRGIQNQFKNAHNGRGCDSPGSHSRIRRAKMKTLIVLLLVVLSISSRRGSGRCAHPPAGIRLRSSDALLPAHTSARSKRAGVHGACD